MLFYLSLVDYFSSRDYVNVVSLYEYIDSRTAIRKLINRYPPKNPRDKSTRVSP